MSEAQVTREQLNELERNLRPVIAKLLGEPVSDTSVFITCTPVLDDPDGASVMRFEIRVRGQEISSEQEEKVSKLLRTPSTEERIVKAKTVPPVY